MDEPDWGLLGIARTSDLSAIRKAYASRLKATRPDDDAQAYQALRTAYDLAQRWAATPTLTQAPPASAPTPIAAKAASPPPLPAPGLVEQADNLWREGGDAGLQVGWPDIAGQLRTRPEAERNVDAQLFAQWLVEREGLPAVVRRDLQQFFGWQRDYRLERTLGADLAEALLAQLEDLEDAPTETPARHAILQLHGLWCTPGRRGTAWWIAALGRPDWLRQLAQNGGNRLKLNARQRFNLRLLLAAAALPRMALLMLVLGAAGFLFFGSSPAVLFALFVLLWPLHLLLQGALWLAGAVLVWDLSLLGGGGPDERSWRVQPARLGVAAALLIAAVGLAAWPMQGRQADIARGFGLMALGASVIAVRWTQSIERSPAVVGCFIVIWAIFQLGLSAWLAPFGAAALAAMWTLLGSADHEGWLGRGHFAQIVRVFAWPVSYTLAASDRWGWRFTYWPLAALTTLAVAADASASSPWLAITLACAWAIAAAATLALQTRWVQIARASLASAAKDKC